MFEDDTLFSFTGKPSYSTLVNYYLNNIGKFNMLAFSKEMYDKTREKLVANDSLDEIAVDRTGKVVVSNGDSLDAITLDEYKKGDYVALTNRELLNLR
jgi:predicted peptidase